MSRRNGTGILSVCHSSIEIKQVVLQFQKLLDAKNLLARAEQLYLFLCFVGGFLLFTWAWEQG